LLFPLGFRLPCLLFSSRWNLRATAGSFAYRKRFCFSDLNGMIKKKSRLYLLIPERKLVYPGSHHSRDQKFAVYKITG